MSKWHAPASRVIFRIIAQHRPFTGHYRTVQGIQIVELKIGEYIVMCVIGFINIDYGMRQKVRLSTQAITDLG